MSLKKTLLSISIALVCAVSLFAQGRQIHTLMLEPVRNEEMTFEDDSCSIQFKYADYDGSLSVMVYNKTGKRAYIEWENARLNQRRIVFGDDSRLSMRNAKSDESIPSKSMSILRDIMAESWVGSDYIVSPISPSAVKKRGGAELDIILPVRFGESEAHDYRIKLAIFSFNPVDMSEIQVGMKAKEVKKIVGKPDDMFVDPWGTANTKATWYYAGNAILEINKGVVSEIRSIKKSYMEE